MMEIKIRPSRSLIIDRLKAKQKLMAEHGKKCGYCGVELPFEQMLELDYYVPWYSKGKPSCKLYHDLGEENFVLACSICNRIKGDKLPINDDGFVTILHPYKDRYNEEITINDLGEAEGKTESAKSTINELKLNRPDLVTYRRSNTAKVIERINDNSTAYETYIAAKGQITSLLTISLNDEIQKEYFYRMLYANVIAAMEAYLSKTLISLVLNNDEFFWRFVEHFDWENEKVRISDIKSTYDKLNIKVQTKLTEVLYHNLPKIKAMYGKILDIQILTDSNEMEILCTAVDIRQDLVHRNGRKKEANAKQEFHTITVKMIEELIEAVDKLVACVEDQLEQIYGTN